MKDVKDRTAGALYGVAVGDALGAPLEFMSKEEIARKHGRVTEMIGGGWLNVEPGEITDDTQMTLAVAEGIVEDPDNPIKAIGKRFIEWARSGSKDIGGTCSMSIHGAISRSHQEAPDEQMWYEASKYTSKANGGRSGGNGALMRTVYPGLYYTDTIAAITGGLAGAIYGYNEIPERWIQTLDPKIRKQLDRLVDAAVKNREGR